MRPNELDQRRRATYDVEAATYERSRFGSRKGAASTRFKDEVALDLLRRSGALDPGRRILDVPTGTGRISRLLLSEDSVEISAVDISPRMLDAQRDSASPGDLARLDLREGNIRDLPFDPDTFDAVVVASFLYLLPADLYREYLIDVARVLKPSGVIVAEIANALPLLSPLTFARVLSQRHMRGTPEKSFVYAWELRRVFGDLIVKELRGTEYPNPWRAYDRYRAVSAPLSRLPILRAVGGKMTVALEPA